MTKPVYPRLCAICGETEKLKYCYVHDGKKVEELHCPEHYPKREEKNDPKEND